jgi:hypothetical protein
VKFVLVAVALSAFVAARVWLRRWVAARWLDDRISNHQAGLLFAMISLAPLIAVGAVLVLLSNAASMLLLAVALSGAVVIGFWLTVIDYMAGHGVKDAIRRSRNRR